MVTSKDESSFSYLFDGIQTFDSMPLLTELLTNKFGGVLEAYAATTVFPPKSIVAALETKAVCNAIRIATGDSRSAMTEKVPVEKTFSGKNMRVILDENLIPNKLFLYCFQPGNNKFRSVNRSSHTQLNHIYTSAGKSPEFFVNLANLCLSPAFMAKLTDLKNAADGSENEVVNLLKFRSFQLYGFNPEGRDFSKEFQKYGHWEQERKWLEIPAENVATFDTFRSRVNSCKDQYFVAACSCWKNPNL